MSEDNPFNKGVQKTILHAGTREPDFSKGSKATFHFSSMVLEPNSDPVSVDDSRVVGKPMELVFGKQFKFPIWEACLRTMREGEVAQFNIQKDLCEGYELVSDSYKKFAGISKKGPQEENRHCCGMNALTGKLKDNNPESKRDMQFKFELLKVETSGHYEMDAWAMEPQEKLDSIPSLREKGNSLYSQKDYSGASHFYQEALGRLEQLLLREKPGEPEFLELEKMKIPLLLNFSQCKLIDNDYYQVIEHTSAVLEKDPENVKALFRRAKAHIGAWNPDQAKADFLKAAELDQKLKGTVLKELNVLDGLRKKKDEEDRQKFEGKMF